MIVKGKNIEGQMQSMYWLFLNFKTDIKSFVGFDHEISKTQVDFSTTATSRYGPVSHTKLESNHVMYRSVDRNKQNVMVFTFINAYFII